MFERLDKPEPAPVFVEHYPDHGVHNVRMNRWQFVEGFAFVGFHRNAAGAFQSPNWQYTTRLTVEVVAGQSL